MKKKHERLETEQKSPMRVLKRKGGNKNKKYTYIHRTKFWACECREGKNVQANRGLVMARQGSCVPHRQVENLFIRSNGNEALSG